MKLFVDGESRDIVLPDSGRRENFPTGAVRDDRGGKGRFDLLSPIALKRLARHYEAGAVKYADRNWEKGIPLSRSLDSALRHLFAFLEGDRTEDHLAAAAWNVFAIMHTEAMIARRLLPEALNDLPASYQAVPLPPISE